MVRSQQPVETGRTATPTTIVARVQGTVGCRHGGKPLDGRDLTVEQVAKAGLLSAAPHRGTALAQP